jgi:hypothetical protein
VLWQAATSTDAARRECALRVLSDVPNIFGQHLATYITEIKALLTQSLTDAQANTSLISVASQVIVAFIVVCLRFLIHDFVELYTALLF